MDVTDFDSVVVSLCLPFLHLAISFAMVVVHCSVHPLGLGPLESAKAWHLRMKARKTWTAVQDACVTVSGGRPSVQAVRSAATRCAATRGHAAPQAKNANCGQKQMLSPEEQSAGGGNT